MCVRKRVYVTQLEGNEVKLMKSCGCQLIWLGDLVQHLECQPQRCGLAPVDGWAAISEAGSLPWRVVGDSHVKR